LTKLCIVGVCDRVTSLIDLIQSGLIPSRVGVTAAECRPDAKAKPTKISADGTGLGIAAVNEPGIRQLQPHNPFERSIPRCRPVGKDVASEIV
jgi:hypothetical protein